MSDKLKFILSSSANFFDVGASSTRSSTSIDDEAVHEFLASEDVQLLCAYQKRIGGEGEFRRPADDEQRLNSEDTNNGGYKLAFTLQLDPDVEESLQFYKVPIGGSGGSGGEIGGGGLRKDFKVGVISIRGGVLNTIYNSVSKVFSPKLSLRQRSVYSAEVSQLLEQLQERISSNLGLPQTGITSLSDESRHWRQMSTLADNKADTERANYFTVAFVGLHEQLLGMAEQNSLHYLEDSLDQLNVKLDELWKSSKNYPESRMVDVLDVIAWTLVELCCDQLNNDDLWSGNTMTTTGTITHVQDIIDSWNQACDTSTRLFWPNYGQRQWLGEPHVPSSGARLKERLDEIGTLRRLHAELSNLLCADETQATWQLLGQMFRPFRRINILDIGGLGERKWQLAKGEMERILRPIDEKIAILLKAKLNGHLSNPRQMMVVFTKYRVITERKAVLEFLRAEREHFLDAAKVLVEDLRKALTTTAEDENNVRELHQQSDSFVSAMCCECRFLKTCERQIDEILSVTHMLQLDVDSNELLHQLDGLREEVKSALNANFEKWCSDSERAIKSGELSLSDDQSVVEFDKSERQQMRVTFDAQLITFCLDYKELEVLGFRLPAHLKHVVVHAQRFIRHARQLQQIAAFHNTIGDRMIPCQRPIMLKQAIELARLVQAESVSWNDEASVERYISSLQECVSRLSKTNSTLCNYHEQIKDIVLRLMSLDLVRQSVLWKAEMKKLREIITDMERKGYENMQGLKLHWDHQLYKVLEFQYVSGMLHLNHKLPDILIELTFRQQQLQFRPPMEEIRGRYFYQLRKFTEKPLDFYGLSDQAQHFFRPMLERNRHHFAGLYRQAETLFLELDVFRDKWVPWVSLGYLELEDICRLHLVEWEDWDRNFRECKHLSQQVAKMQTTPERIECFVVDVQPLKMDIELITRRFWEALANSLRASIVDHLSALDEFVRSALNTLQMVGTSSFGIAESSAQYERIKVALPQMERLLMQLRAKDTCLAGWCKERVATLSAVEGRWDQLQPLIENHSEVIQQHITMMREQVETQLRNLSEEAEKFLIRWQATMREIEANSGDNSTLNLYRERKEQWAMLVGRKTALQTDCEKYSISLAAGVDGGWWEVFDRVEGEMIQSGQQWDIYETFVLELSTVTSEEWIVYRRRPYAFNDFLTKWQNDVHLSRASVATAKIRQQIDLFASLGPTLQTMQSDALTDKHWATILTWLGQPVRSAQELLLKDVLNAELTQHTVEIQQLVKQANSELIVRQALSELEQWGAVTSFKMIEVSDSQGMKVTVIRDYQEVVNKIGDHQCLLQSAKNSSGFDSFNDQAEIWEGRLSTLEVVLDQLSKVQRKWIYLEPVFRNKTIGSDDTTFMRIDKDFRYIMREISHDSRVLSLLKLPNVVGIVQSLDLQRCHNVLATFMAEKRNAFPRFYFLSEDDLLELLGQSNKDAVVQRHIKKLFPAINQLGIEATAARETTATGRLICNIRSAEGDTLSLRNPIEITGSVEDWLNKLDLEIKATLRASLAEALREQQQENKSNSITSDSLAPYPMQVLCLSRAITFTRSVERAIPAMNLATVSKAIMTEIDQLTNLIASHSEPPANVSLKLKCKALLLDLVHYASIVRLLIRHHVTNPQDWHWLKQMRFYGHATATGPDHSGSSIKIRMVYAEFDYSFEYLGNVNKLVNTRLTERCYLTLTQSMQLGLGGNPFGPSGTGKTECVKSLGAMLGRLVLVFNCNENVDSRAIGLILIGLARSGAWGCFDEFNRLQEQTLSAISMQIQPLQQAVKAKAETVTLLKQTIPLDLHCGVFVTLNPAGEDYGGRQKLPGNIQDLFRPIVMQQPEPEEICRVMLFIEGFREVDGISDRVVELFGLCSKMLSPQRHYDWGLRELKTILTASGNALRAIKLTSSKTNVVTASECDVIASVLRTSISSKLTVPDSNIFNLLMSIIFPSANPKALDGHRQELIDALTETFTVLGLAVNGRQLGKCVELHEQLTKRMGVMVVGRPGTGKTTLMNALRQTLVRQGQQIRTYTISPKSMSLQHFLGQLDVDTRQWQDGVLTATAQAVVAAADDGEQHVTRWIICDGDVDPVWIEALNSVLDDNKLLTLPSGWRIQFGGNVNFLFETHDLQHASPATISRMGIINVNPEDFPETLFVDRFYLSGSGVGVVTGGGGSEGDEQQIIKLFIEKYLWRAIDWLQQRADDAKGMVVPRSGGSGRAATDDSRRGFMPFPSVVGRSNWINWALQAIRNENNNNSANWSGGGGTGENTRNITNNNNNTVATSGGGVSNGKSGTITWCKERFGMVLVNSLSCALPTADDKVAFIKAIIYDWMELSRLAPTDDQLVNLYFDRQRQTVDVYRDGANGPQGRTAAANEDIDGLLIGTPQINGYLDVLRDFLIGPESSPFLLVGPSGTGKTLLVQEAVNQMAAGYQLITINCSAQLSADHIRHVLRESLAAGAAGGGARGGGGGNREYRPRMGRRRAIVFLKNLNLLRVDCYGTSDVVELLLEIVYRSGFYGTCQSPGNEWISVAGLQICGSLTIDPAQEFNKLSPRLINLCRYLVVAPPRDEDLQMIIIRQLKCLSFVNWKIRPESIAATILGVFNQLKGQLRAAATKNNKHALPHYEFSPKIMSRVIAYLQRYPGDNIAEAVGFELVQIFRNRLSTVDDAKIFDEILSNNIRNLVDNQAAAFLPTSAFMPELINNGGGSGSGWGGRVRLYSREELLHQPQLIEKYIEICNNEDIHIEVPFTETLLNNILAVARVVCAPSAHLVMCGSVGSGRREAVHIVAQLMQFKLHTIQAATGQSYGKVDFYQELKGAMQSAALEDANTVLLIDFTWLNHCPELMVPVEAILEGSDIPELFGDELENVAAPLKQAAQNDNFEESLASYFMKRVQRNLHLIVLLEQEEGAYLNGLLDQYPALHRNAEMCWSLPATAADAHAYIPGICKLIDCPEEKVKVPSYAVEALSLVPAPLCRSPLRLLQFIKTFTGLHVKTAHSISCRCDVLKCGIEKLSEAHQIVDKLRGEAKQQQEALNEKRKLAAQSLELISSTMRSASDQKTDLLALRKATEESSVRLQERTKAIDLQLREVEPLLREARAAVGQIKSEALSEIRSLRAPPEVIRDILEGVLRIMGIRDTSWNSMKSFLAKRGVKEDIRSLDPARITTENCAAIQKLMQTKADSFDEKIAKRASVAAAPLAAWVIANVQFARVSQSIRPLEREQEELQKNLQKAEADMQSLTSSLDDVDARVRELSQQLNLYTQEAAVLEIKLGEVQQTLKTAEMLVSKLAAEFRTWSQECETLQSDLQAIDGQVFLKALTLTHLSGLALEERRNILLDIFQHIPELQQEFNMFTEQEKIQWDSYGLPSDQQSMENAAVVRDILRARFRDIPIPCLLDPSEYAHKWLLSYLAAKSFAFEVTSQADERFSYKLELAIRFGKTLLVRDVERFTAPLLSIITSDLHVRYNKRMLQVGNKLVDLHENFKLILVTRSSAWDERTLRADVASRLALIPFVNTESGYCDQLVSKSICLMQPQLEEKRIQLLLREGELLEERGRVQEKLLAELSAAASGDLLRNESLIKSLNAAKESSDEIDRSLTESQEVRQRLQADYSKYRKLCAKVARLFMGLAGTYRSISTQTYTGEFLKVLQRQEQGLSQDKEDDRIFSRFIRQIYFTIARTIAKSGYTELGLLICKNAFSELVPHEKWEPFITNFMPQQQQRQDNSEAGSVAHSWLSSKDCASKVASFAAQLPSLYKALNLEDQKLWDKFMTDSASSSNEPPQFPVKLPCEFDKILVAQLLRPDLLLSVIQSVVTKLLGFNYMAVLQPTVHQLSSESRCDRPVLILSDPGTDPSRDLKELATSARAQYNELSVAQGQEKETLEVVRRAVREGHWVCLKNIHLLPRLITELESEMTSVLSGGGRGTEAPPHADFRLWIICESLNGFSESFVMKSISVLFELPNGLKLKVQRLLRMWESSLSGAGGGGAGMADGEFLKLAFALFLLAGVLQERRNFIPQGFTKWYDFADADLRVAIDFVRMLLQRQKEGVAMAVGGGGRGRDTGGGGGAIEWNFVQKIIEIVAFGGRLSNEQDLRVLVAHIRNFFRPNLFSATWNVLPLLKDVLTGALPSLSARPSDYHEYLDNAFGDAAQEVDPQNFGLPRNARALQNVQICRQLLKQLRGAAAAKQEANLDRQRRLKPILSLWKNLNQKMSIPDKRRIAEGDAETATATDPWRVFKLSEVELAAKLFEAIQSTLFQVYQLAKSGNESDPALLQLSDNHVPVSWKRLWNGPRTATNYLQAMAVRATEAGHRLSSPQPASVDLSRMFNVDTFFAALKLVAARDHPEDISTTEVALTLRLAKTAAPAAPTKDHLNAIALAPLIIEGGLNFDNTAGVGGMLTRVRAGRENKGAERTPELILVLSRTKAPAPGTGYDDADDDFGNGVGGDGELAANECSVPLYSSGNRDKLIYSFKLPIESHLSTLAVYSALALIIPDVVSQ